MLAGRLSAHTRAAYALDLRQWQAFLEARGILTPHATSRDVAAWRDELHTAGAATATINRKLATVRQLYEEAITRGEMGTNPAKRVPGYRGTGDSETRGLTRDEALALLANPDRTTLMGTRDYALLMLLLRIGLRRAEVAALRVGDLGYQQGHRTLTVAYGKGGKRRLLKMPAPAGAALDAWTVRAGITDVAAPLFCYVRRWKTSTGYGERAEPADPLHPGSVWFIVHRHAAAAGLGDLHPHCLRHTFVTLALDGGAPLHKVQRAAGHADPRTTERYWRSKNDLDDSAMDYVHL
jgi:site-specific recombinase XerD